MKTLVRTVCAWLVAALVLALVGCAGGGSGPTVTGSTVAPGQGAAAVFVQQWAQILWGLLSRQTGGQEPTQGPITPSPDGSSFSQTFTGADGTVTVLTVFTADGSARLDITFPDGSTQTVEQSPPAYDTATNETTIVYEVQSSSGLTVDYTAVVDDQGNTNGSDDTTTLDGTSVLPDGKEQQFHVATVPGQTATDPGWTTLDSTQSDGSQFRMVVPLKPPDYFEPDFSRQATGRYQDPEFDIRFTLDSVTSAPSRWASMSSTLGSGMTGQFAVGLDFAGQGRLTKGADVVATLSWTRGGKIEIRFVSAESSAASPAGAALDYLVHRWQSAAALMFVGTSSAGVPCRTR